MSQYLSLANVRSGGAYYDAQGRYVNQYGYYMDGLTLKNDGTNAINLDVSGVAAKYYLNSRTVNFSSHTDPGYANLEAAWASQVEQGTGIVKLYDNGNAASYEINSLDLVVYNVNLAKEILFVGNQTNVFGTSTKTATQLTNLYGSDIRIREDLVTPHASVTDYNSWAPVVSANVFKEGQVTTRAGVPQQTFTTWGYIEMGLTSTATADAAYGTITTQSAAQSSSILDSRGNLHTICLDRITYDSTTYVGASTASSQRSPLGGSKGLLTFSSANDYADHVSFQMVGNAINYKIANMGNGADTMVIDTNPNAMVLRGGGGNDNITINFAPVFASKSMSDSDISFLDTHYATFTLDYNTDVASRAGTNNAMYEKWFSPVPIVRGDAGNDTFNWIRGDVLIRAGDGADTLIMHVDSVMSDHYARSQLSAANLTNTQVLDLLCLYLGLQDPNDVPLIASAALCENNRGLLNKILREGEVTITSFITDTATVNAMSHISQATVLDSGSDPTMTGLRLGFGNLDLQDTGTVTGDAWKYGTVSSDVSWKDSDIFSDDGAVDKLVLKFTSGDHYMLAFNNSASALTSSVGNALQANGYSFSALAWTPTGVAEAYHLQAQRGSGDDARIFRTDVSQSTGGDVGLVDGVDMLPIYFANGGGYLDQSDALEVQVDGVVQMSWALLA